MNTNSNLFSAIKNTGPKKVAIVTGANSGIGYFTVQKLALEDYHVIMACRNLQEGNEAKNAIVKKVPNALLTVELIDLLSFNSVNDFCDRIEKKYNSLSLLVNNAGINAVPYSITENNFESTLQVNYLSHFLLTMRLFPLLLVEHDARIVHVSSYAHHFSELNLNNLQHELNLKEKNYDRHKAYQNSKLANVLFGFELHRRIQEHNLSVKSIVVHPGSVKTKMLYRNPDTDFVQTLLIMGETIVGQHPEDGASSTLFACLDKNVQSGEFYGPDKINELWGQPTRVNPSVIAKSEDGAKSLWEYTEKMLNIEFILTKPNTIHARQGIQ